ncbi:MAG: hypothetical protein MJ133_01600 [Lachnospiraceae bacterium]|nr:hypothetical protein [Lachnospiraceae bacterium]
MRVLVTGGTKDDAIPIAVFIINVAKTNSHLFDKVIVYHDGISHKIQRQINDFFPTEFIYYDYPLKTKNDAVLSRFSKMVFCKYECFKLLQQYETVVWSDYDVVLLRKLDIFCNPAPNTINGLQSYDSLRRMLFKDITNKEISSSFNIDQEGFGTALFSFSRDIKNYQQIYEWCYEKTKTWSEDLYLPEQCIFSMAIQKFNIPLVRFPFDKYACHPSNKTVGDEYIIHAYGSQKFWDGINYPIWNNLYEEWLKAGGLPYRKFKKRIKQKLVFIKTRLMGVRHKEHG